MQGLDAKIIPVIEKRIFDFSNTELSERAFIFSVKQGSHYVLIWENVFDSRASHLFKCHENKYRNALQALYDYIASEKITNKREKLSRYRMDYFSNDVLSYIGCVNHTTPDEWERNIRAKVFQRKI